MDSMKFLAFALPAVIITLVIALIVVNHYGSALQEWGKKHIK